MANNDIELPGYLDDGSQPGDVPEDVEDEFDDYDADDVPEQYELYRAPQASYRAGMLLISIGAVLCFLGVAMGVFMSQKPELLEGQWTSYGISPGILTLGGILLLTLGFTHQRNHRFSTESILVKIEDELANLHQQFDELLLERLPDNAAPSGSALQQLQLAMQKIESMLSNLNKATRMFNKPLLDLVGKVTDLEKGMQDAEGIRKKVLETQDEVMRAQKDMKTDLQAIERAMQEAHVTNEKKWEGLVSRFHTDTDGLADTVKKALAELELDEQGLEKVLEKLEAIMTQLESGDTGPSANSAMDSHRLTRIETAVNQLLERGPIAPADTSGFAPTPPAPAPEPAAATVSSSSSDSKSSDKPKKVMSAIERLKQLRGG